ncbi:MAG: ribonuclease HII [Candidatus Pacebacteria bacterium]|nr:ribonuclease HII [Candidatus Paceibacterota bacterium]MBP9840699.1 ribonuclease HII [Candidatus Paceibacterota bacterium]
MSFLLGVDEAGRGPLAGPVAVGLVIVEEGFDVALEFPGVADSKAISESKREKLFTLLEERARRGDVRFVVEYGEAAEIDERGIVPAIRSAVARGVRFLAPELSGVRILLDGSLSAPEGYAQETIVRGDATVPLISLASIAAKVRRDRLMLELANAYPEYGFEKHKGYGTKAHYEALRMHGPSVIHRRSFLGLIKN